MLEEEELYASGKDMKTKVSAAIYRNKCTKCLNLFQREFQRKKNVDAFS